MFMPFGNWPYPYPPTYQPIAEPSDSESSISDDSWEMSDSSEEDEDDVCMLFGLALLNGQMNSQRARRSVRRRKKVLRDLHMGALRIDLDYFGLNPVYDGRIFRRRYRMQRPLFEYICDTLAYRYSYFKQLPNCTGLLGCTTRQKCTAAMRMLAYASSADQVDAEVRMGKSTILEATKLFVRGIVEVFGETYLRRPNEQDIGRLLHIADAKGFPEMLGSIDCMHWAWEACPTAEHGFYKGHVDHPTIILEAVAGPDLWFWHAYFGLPGSLNDINVLDRSHVFDEIASGNGPQFHYTANGRNYDMGYYLADGIYPDWATLIKGIRSPANVRDKHFTKLQASYRKDVERAFGVLQARYKIVKNPAKFWDPEDLEYIMKACIILHNMTIENERHIPLPQVRDYECATEHGLGTSRKVPEIDARIERHRRIRSKTTHHQLRDDLVAHVWEHSGGADEVSNGAREGSRCIRCWVRGGVRTSGGSAY